MVLSLVDLFVSNQLKVQHRIVVTLISINMPSTPTKKRALSSTPISPKDPPSKKSKICETEPEYQEEEEDEDDDEEEEHEHDTQSSPKSGDSRRSLNNSTVNQGETTSDDDGHHHHEDKDDNASSNMFGKMQHIVKKHRATVETQEISVWEPPPTPKTPSITLQNRIFPHDPLSRILKLKQLIGMPIFVFSPDEHHEEDLSDKSRKRNSTESPFNTGGESMFLTLETVSAAVADLQFHDLRAVALGELLPDFEFIWNFYLRRVVEEDPLLKTVDVQSVKLLFKKRYDRDIYDPKPSFTPIMGTSSGDIDPGQLGRIKNVASKWFKRQQKRSIEEYGDLVSPKGLAQIYANSIFWTFGGGSRWLYRKIVTLLLSFGEDRSISKYNPFKFSIDISKGTPLDIQDFSKSPYMTNKFRGMDNLSEVERRAIVLGDRYLNMVTYASTASQYVTLDALELSKITTDLHNLCVHDLSVLLESDRLGLITTFIENNFDKKKRGSPFPNVTRKEMYEIINKFLKSIHAPLLTREERKSICVYQESNKYTATGGYWNLVPNQKSLADQFLKEIRVEDVSQFKKPRKNAQTPKKISVQELCRALLQSEEAFDALRRAYEASLSALEKSYPNSNRIAKFVEQHSLEFNKHWFPENVRTLRKCALQKPETTKNMKRRESRYDSPSDAESDENDQDGEEQQEDDEEQDISMGDNSDDQEEISEDHESMADNLINSDDDNDDNDNDDSGSDDDPDNARSSIDIEPHKQSEWSSHSRRNSKSVKSVSIKNASRDHAKIQTAKKAWEIDELSAISGRVKTRNGEPKKNRRKILQ